MHDSKQSAMSESCREQSMVAILLLEAEQRGVDGLSLRLLATALRLELGPLGGRVGDRNNGQVALRGGQRAAGGAVRGTRHERGGVHVEARQECAHNSVRVCVRICIRVEAQRRARRRGGERRKCRARALSGSHRPRSLALLNPLYMRREPHTVVTEDRITLLYFIVCTSLVEYSYSNECSSCDIHEKIAERVVSNEQRRTRRRRCKSMRLRLRTYVLLNSSASADFACPTSRRTRGNTCSASSVCNSSAATSTIVSRTYYARDYVLTIGKQEFLLYTHEKHDSGDSEMTLLVYKAYFRAIR